LAKQLHLAAVVEPKRIKQLVADLDSAEFKIRMKAQTDLVTIGEQAVSYLDEALANNPALQTRQRLNYLQAKPVPGLLTNERALLVRTIEELARGKPQLYVAASVAWRSKQRKTAG
jgi:hypothetical protein